MNQEKLRLGDLITFQRGFDITAKEQVVGNIPVISSGGVSSYHNEYKVEGPGVVIGRKGTLGTVHFSEGNFWPHDTTLWVKNFKGNDPKFIYYFLKTLKLERFDAGASNPTLNRNHIHKLKVQVPAFEFRSKIASVLSAYDDLIENNNQRINLMEQMAEEIFKEWFVRLRFPGYENLPFVEGVPVGWEKIKMRDCIEHYIGGGWGDEEPKGKNELPAYVIRGTDIPDFRVGQLNFEVLRYHSASNLNNRRLEADDIVFEVSGGTETQSLGRTAFLQKETLERFEQDVICASFCKLIRVNKKIISPVYINSLLNRLYATGELMVFQVQSTGICNYQFEDFLNAQTVLKPSQEIQQEFEDTISPMLKEIQVLGAKNENLQQTRDLLLPRLISGRLSVEHLLEKSQMQLAN